MTVVAYPKQFNENLNVKICLSVSIFFFNDTATTEIYTLSLHDALPISERHVRLAVAEAERGIGGARRCSKALVPRWRSGSAFVVHDRSARAREMGERSRDTRRDRKSTRLNSSHSSISYAVFCLKKKNKI